MMARRAALDDDMAAALRQVQMLSLYPGDRTLLPVGRQRELMEAERRWWNEAGPQMAREWRFEIEGPLRRVPIQALQPRSANPQAPWIVWFHGGGWVLGSPRTHASLMRGLAQASGCTVLAVDYALAPEYRFPDPVHEAEHVLAALAADAPRMGLAPGAMVVGGDSSGANVALAAALALARVRPATVRAGVFYYGVFDDTLDDESSLAYGGGEFGLSVSRMRWYWDTYAPDTASRGDGRLNLQRAELSQAFPMYLMAAECDILRDGATRFAMRLQDAGVQHMLRRCTGMGHAFMGHGRLIPAVARVHQEAAAFVHQVAGATPRA